MNRLDFFKERLEQDRFWWFRQNDYLPGIYAELSDEEWVILQEYFEETRVLNYIGECNIPLMSEMLGFIDGSNLHKIVQLGHYAGWSSLLLGWKLRRMGRKLGLWSIDILNGMTAYAQGWLDRADLEEYVTLVVGDSTEPMVPRYAEMQLGSLPDLIFVDSSHTYAGTKQELHSWFPYLQVGGLMIFHDAGMQAVEYDKSGMGGVKRALDEWLAENREQEAIMLNRTVPWGKMIRLDGCGAAIIQKTAVREG